MQTIAQAEDADDDLGGDSEGGIEQSAHGGTKPAGEDLGRLTHQLREGHDRDRRQAKDEQRRKPQPAGDECQRDTDQHQAQQHHKPPH